MAFRIFKLVCGLTFLLVSCEFEPLFNACWFLSASWCRLRNWLCPLSASHPQESLLRRLEDIDHDLARSWRLWLFAVEVKDGVIPWFAFCIQFKMKFPSIICCNTWVQDGLSLSFKANQQIVINFLPVGFEFDFEVPRNPSRALRRISKISKDVAAETSLADQKTQHKLSDCDVSTLANDGISPLQHFRTNRCDRTAWATQITELWVSRFGSRHTFLPAVIGASVDSSTSVNMAKSLWIFLTGSLWTMRNYIKAPFCIPRH